MDSRTAELEKFKRLNLCDYAATRGYVFDRKSSSRHSFVLRHATGDKLIVGKAANGTFYYFNAKGPDSGTIIDLVQALDGGTIGDVRRTLRAYEGNPGISAPSSTLPFTLQPSEHDAARVLSTWMQAKPLKSKHAYLTDVRGIPFEVLSAPIFSDLIRTDHRGNALFKHYNQSGLCGFEIKNGKIDGSTFTGFSPGGVKGLACSKPREDDHVMVIAESTIDMLSFAALEGTAGKRFFSTAGQISPQQAACLRSALEKMSTETTHILLALDNDDGGKKLARDLRDALATAQIPIHDRFPDEIGLDWNDVLRRQISVSNNATLKIG